MKKILKVLIVLSFIIGYFVLNAWSDYSWEQRYLAEKGDKWILYKKFANVADPIHFYSFIKTPTTRIGMFDKTITQKLTDGVYYVRLLWVDKELGGGVTEEDFKYIIDCDNKKEGWKKGKNGNENIELSEINTIDVSWSGFYENEEKYPESATSKELQCKILEDNIP